MTGSLEVVQAVIMSVVQLLDGRTLSNVVISTLTISSVDWVRQSAPETPILTAYPFGSCGR